MKYVSLVAATALLSIACGQEVTAPDVEAFLQASRSAGATLEGHCSEEADSSDCGAAQERYEGEMGPLVERLYAMSPDMDACMRAMGHSGFADMMATSRSMMDEFRLHAHDACGVATTRSGEVERQRHCRVMGGLLEHQTARAESMLGMMGHENMMSGGQCRD